MPHYQGVYAAYHRTVSLVCSMSIMVCLFRCRLSSPSRYGDHSIHRSSSSPSAERPAQEAMTNIGTHFPSARIRVLILLIVQGQKRKKNCDRLNPWSCSFTHTSLIQSKMRNMLQSSMSFLSTQLLKMWIFAKNHYVISALKHCNLMNSKYIVLLMRYNLLHKLSCPCSINRVY